MALYFLVFQTILAKWLVKLGKTHVLFNYPPFLASNRPKPAFATLAKVRRWRFSSYSDKFLRFDRKNAGLKMITVIRKSIGFLTAR
ncbi:hypothetical protein [uncultured Bartonella sp.]|uniref:hypothetical protein n=1 Tax=uncultured Bartonella sp. TaxID=104108 RepID=UPI0026137D76|nr:hypothetical protein [uncultured Bartonella sp.]